MNRILKYTLEVQDEQKVDLPIGAIILSAVSQFNNVVIYAQVDAKESLKLKRTIKVVATGQQFDEANLKFINTVVLHQGQLIFHVFEVV